MFRKLLKKFFGFGKPEEKGIDIPITAVKSAYDPEKFSLKEFVPKELEEYISPKTKKELGPIQKEWIQYLKAHPDEQYKEYLGRIIDGKEKCCCLGRGGIIAGVCMWENDVLKTTKDEEGYQSNQTLGFNTFKKLGLKDQNGNPRDNFKFNSLALLNDEKMTWPEIAALLEEHPEQYFTHPI